MPKPPKPPRVKKSMDWRKDDHEEITRLAKKDGVTWAEMARTIVSKGLWAYRAKDK